MDYDSLWNGRREGFRRTMTAETPPINSGLMVPVRDAGPAIPRYLSDTYTRACLNPRNVKLVDRELVVQTKQWWQHGG